MYHELPPKRCSKCGSVRSEHVLRDRKEYTRCRDCGHEKLDVDHTPRGDSIVWESVSTENVF
nr:hypothetical protein 4 [Gammaproteobacteria bacterium]